MGFGSQRGVWQVRQFEIGVVLDLLQQQGARGRLLEVGAACGDQARFLSQHGYQVTAVDVVGSCWNPPHVFPVLSYDGRHLPFADNCFDIVFSSNVLEHIPHVQEMLRHELRRVLKPGGLMVHVLPSASWRFWTSLTYYPELPWKILRRLRKGNTMGNHPGYPSRPGNVVLKGLRALLPTHHGEHGNLFTEFWTFSRWHWQSLFEKTGWGGVKHRVGGVWYTGYGLLGEHLAIGFRRRLAWYLGSSTHVFWMSKEG